MDRLQYWIGIGMLYPEALACLVGDETWAAINELPGFGKRSARLQQEIDLAISRKPEKWHNDPVTDAQLQKIDFFGLSADRTALTKGSASRFIDFLVKVDPVREKAYQERSPSAEQLQQLLALGCEVIPDSYGAAAKEIWRLKESRREEEWTRQEEAEERQIKRIIGNTEDFAPRLPWCDKAAVLLGGYLPDGFKLEQGISLVDAMTDEHSTTIEGLSQECGQEPASREQMTMLEELSGEAFGQLTKEQARRAIAGIRAEQAHEEDDAGSFSRRCLLLQKRTAADLSHLKSCIPAIEADLKARRAALERLKRQVKDATTKDEKQRRRAKRDAAYASVSSLEIILGHFKERLRELDAAEQDAVRDRILFWQGATGKNVEGALLGGAAEAECEEYRKRYPAKVLTQGEVTAILAALDEQVPDWEVSHGAQAFFGTLARNLPHKVGRGRR